MHEHTCHLCTAICSADSRTSLPAGWRWLTRALEGLNAAPVCPSCAEKKLPRMMLRRIGGNASRKNRSRSLS